MPTSFLSATFYQAANLPGRLQPLGAAGAVMAAAHIATAGYASPSETR